MSRGHVVLFALGLLGAGFIVAHTALAPEGLTRRAQLERDLATADAQVAAAEARVADLRRQIEALRTRPDVQERVVRDELGYVRQADLVLELGSPTR